MTLDLGSSDYKNRSGPARISSANPNKRNSQKFPESSNNPAYNESALFKDNNRANSLSNNQYTSNQFSKLYGAAAEQRQKSFVPSRAHNQKSIAVSHENNTHNQSNGSVPNLTQNLSSANMGGQHTLASGNSYQNIGHQRQKGKLPIGFLVQQEKRELHKVGMNLGGRMRPDSAKVTLGNRSRGLLAHEV